MILLSQLRALSTRFLGTPRLLAALCYLEATCTKIPELTQQEKAGIQLETQPDRIAMATKVELQAELDL